jgi:hypothetical protein
MHTFVVDCEKSELIFAFHGKISSILLSFRYRSCSSNTAELIFALWRAKYPKAPQCYVARTLRDLLDFTNVWRHMAAGIAWLV